MSALSETLVTTQRQTLAAMGRAYVAGAITLSDATAIMDGIGCTEKIEQGYLIAALEALRGFGVEAPKPPAPTNDRKPPEPPSEAQTKLIERMAREHNVPAPDWITSKEQASEIIDAIKAGTYDPSKYDKPF